MLPPAALLQPLPKLQVVVVCEEALPRITYSARSVDVSPLNESLATQMVHEAQPNVSEVGVDVRQGQGLSGPNGQLQTSSADVCDGVYDQPSVMSLFALRHRQCVLMSVHAFGLAASWITGTSSTHVYMYEVCAVRFLCSCVCICVCVAHV